MHFSPPCTEFSRALTSRPRRLEEGDILAKRSLEILSYFRPRWWTLENPVGLLQTGLTWKICSVFCRFVCYCKCNEGDHPYRKQIEIWTNIAWNPRPMCTKASPCADKAKHGKHIHHAQQGALPGLRTKTNTAVFFPAGACKRVDCRDFGRKLGFSLERWGIGCALGIRLINRKHICFASLPYLVFRNYSIGIVVHASEACVCLKQHFQILTNVVLNIR